MSNPKQIDHEDRVSRFSIGPGLVALIAFIVIILAAIITYVLVTH